jgi:MtrB/PioB family decaheme-associated outer membrane protein
MRTRVLTLTILVLLASRAAWTQAPQPSQGQPPQPQVPASAFTGTVDFGGLATTADGDEARYERYRDTRDGAYSNISLDRQGVSYLFNASASHIGYRDQRYNAALASRKVNVGFQWMSLPLNYSYIARTPFTTNDDVLTLDDNAQRAVQGPTFAPADGLAVGVPCAPGAPPAACGTPAQAAQAKANRSIYDGLATTFDLRQQRNTAAVAFNYAATRALDLDARFSSSSRDGQQPWGASFAFNTAVELPKPLDDRTNDLSVGATWANPRGMFRLGWDGSWFNNHFTSLTWDNPILFNDFTNGLTPPNGPYDPNGYSNGNGPGQGRESVAPSNTMNVVSAVGLYKLRGRTTLNGTVQLTSQTQDATLIPFTINPVINSPVVFAAFPHLAQLPRSTAQGEAKGINTLISLSSRPFRPVNVTVRYRFNDRDVRTPVFDATEYVRFDAVPEEIEEGHSPQFDSSRHLFDANVAVTPVRWGTIRLGYGHEAIERTGRGFADVGEHILRASFDTYTSQYVTVRAGVDVGWRRGEGFVETHPISETEDLSLITGPGGTQPTLRYYDEADRNRTRGSVMVTVFPRDSLDVFVQFAGTRDRYRPDDTPVSRPGELFGLQQADTASWVVGLNVHPTDVVSAGASYGRDRYGSFQRSRNANPPPDPTWTDPNRDWTLDNDDVINNVGIFLDVLRAVRNTDIRFGYDYSDSDNSFVHGGPRIAALTAANQFIPLPDVENTWQRVSADVQYFFTQRAGVGVGYYFETLDIGDFNTIDTSGPVGFAPATGEPRIDWLGGLLTGYGNRPYTGHTATVRVIYRF